MAMVNLSLGADENIDIGVDWWDRDNKPFHANIRLLTTGTYDQLSIVVKSEGDGTVKVTHIQNITGE